MDILAYKILKTTPAFTVAAVDGQLRHILTIKHRDQFLNMGPCVVEEIEDVMAVYRYRTEEPDTYYRICNGVVRKVPAMIDGKPAPPFYFGTIVEP